MASSTATAGGGGGGAARGGLNPPPQLPARPNPSGDGGGPRLRSPPGKGNNNNRPAALVDITNTGKKPSTARSIAVPDLVKENTKLISLLNEKTKIIDLSRIEIYKLRLALQASKQQNLQLAQSNSQILAETNAVKDRMKILQHELSCATALLKVKGSEHDRNRNAAKGQRKGVKSQETEINEQLEKTDLKEMQESCSKKSGDNYPRKIGDSAFNRGSQSAVSLDTVCQEPPQDGKQKRLPQRRSLRLNQGSCEIGRVSQNTLHEDTVAPLALSPSCVQKQYGHNTGKHIEKEVQNECSATVHELETEINEQPQITNLKEIQEACSRKSGDNGPYKIDDNAFNSKQSHLTGSQSALSSNTVCQEPPQDGKQKRMPTRRRSSRLNQDSCEISGLSQNTLHEDTVAPLVPSTTSVQKQYVETPGIDMEKSMQNGCSAKLHEVVMASASQSKETEINGKPGKTNLKEIQEACCSEGGVESHKIGDKAFNSKENYLTGSESSMSFNTVDPPEPPEDITIKGCSKKRSAIEDVNAKLDTTTREPLRHGEKRKSRRRKSARLNLVSSEDMDITVETEQKDVIAPLAGSGSNASRTNQEQNDDCSSRKSNQEQIPGRRSLRRAAEKVVSYKEIPLNVKMRRPAS